MASDALAALIAAELHMPVGPAARAMAEHCRRRHGQAVVGVLFYGSCLRQPDQALTDALLDFYVIVDDYASAYDNRLLAWANALLPPNVFYVELPWQGTQLRAKYAVISLRQFTSGCSRAARNVSIWARFCQPARLIWAKNPTIDAALAAALADACRTMFGDALPLLAPAERTDPIAVWRRGFAETYAAELRSESSDRALAIVAASRQVRECCPKALPPLFRILLGPAGFGRQGRGARFAAVGSARRSRHSASGCPRAHRPGCQAP